MHVANRLEKPLPDEPFLPFRETHPEKSLSQTITAPAPAVIKEVNHSAPIKSMLRRYSGKPRRLAVTFVDAMQSTAPEPKIPASPAETLDNIVFSYGSMSPGNSPYTARPNSGANTSQPSPMSPETPILSPPPRTTSRWSMSTSADDVTQIGRPILNFNTTRRSPNNVTAGLPSNPRARI